MRLNKIAVILLLSGLVSVTMGQQVITPTPVPFTNPTEIPSLTPTPFETEIPPTFTPETQGPPQIVVPDNSGAINARAEPSTDSFILGQIQPGEQYLILGQYFKWIQFQYPPSPSGYAYVFGDLVEIIGDRNLILDLTQEEEVELDLLAALATETAEALRLLPGFDATQTASVREIEPPSGLADDGVGGANQILPTFTFPPHITPLASTDDGSGMDELRFLAPDTQRSVDDGIAPMVPIVLFATLGVIGFLLSFVRR